MPEMLMITVNRFLSLANFEIEEIEIFLVFTISTFNFTNVLRGLCYPICVSGPQTLYSPATTVSLVKAQIAHLNINQRDNFTMPCNQKNTFYILFYQKAKLD